MTEEPEEVPEYCNHVIHCTLFQLQNAVRG